MTDDTLKRTSSYSVNRRNYMTSDGAYVYWRWDEELKKEVPVYLTPENDGVMQEIIIALDSWDYDEDLGDRYEKEHADYSFQNCKTMHNTDSEAYELAADTTDLLEAVGSDPFSILFPDEEITDARIEQLLSLMDKLTPAQVDLIYAIYGERRKIIDIADSEGVTEAAIRNRRNKIIARLTKLFKEAQ